MAPQGMIASLHGFNRQRQRRDDGLMDNAAIVEEQNLPRVTCSHSQRPSHRNPRIHTCYSGHTRRHSLQCFQIQLLHWMVCRQCRNQVHRELP